MKSVPLKRIYWSGNEIVTEDELISLTDQCALASISDIEDMGCLGITYKDFVLEVIEGKYAWYESQYICVLPDMNTYDCGYVKVG